MPEESTAPDPVALVRLFVDAASARDLDAMTLCFAPDAVWDVQEWGKHEGHQAIREFFEGWWGGYDELTMEAEEILDMGNGVVFAVMVQEGRLSGSSHLIAWRSGMASVSVDGVLASVRNYTSPSAARAAAERLAEERG